jgi:nitroreductase
MPTIRQPRWVRSGVDVIDAIYQRRAVREYTPRRVATELVETLIDAAIQAPSAVNQQPWAFVVVQDAELLARVSDRAKQLCLARLPPAGPGGELRDVLLDPAFRVFYDATTLIVICGRQGTSWPAEEDCCLAAQNLMLAAHALGLGTCPIGLARGALNEAATKGELGIPEDHAVVMPILVGYPRSTPDPVPREEPRILRWVRPA